MGTENKQSSKTKTSGYNNNTNDNSGIYSGSNQKYVSSYVSPDFNFLMKVGAEMQARYDQNKDYRDKLIDWVLDLKTKTNDATFLNAMNKHYNKLRAMDNGSFGELGNELDIIKQNIKEDISNYNAQKKEEPKRLWDSGNENLENKNYSQAVQDFTNLLQSNSKFYQAYLYRGYAYENQGKYHLALTDLNNYIEIVNDDPLAYRTRGWSKYHLADYMGALADFNKKIELEPKSSDGYYSRGSAKSQLGDLNGSINDYTKAIELLPTNSMCYNNRGWSKFKQKKYAEALIDLNKAIELDPTNYIAYDSRMEVKFAMNDLKGCMDDCMSVIKLNDKVANTWFFRGRCNYKNGFKILACGDWSKAGELGLKEAYEYINKYCK
jgi:tetratricopeptide (TPR) repeat protein